MIKLVKHQFKAGNSSDFLQLNLQFYTSQRLKPAMPLANSPWDPPPMCVLSFYGVSEALMSWSKKSVGVGCIFVSSSGCRRPQCALNGSIWAAGCQLNGHPASLLARVETWGLGFGSLPYNPVARTSFNNYSPNLLKSFRNPFCWKHRPRVCSVLHRPALPGVCWLSVEQKNRRKLMLKFSRGRRLRSSLTDLNLESLNLEVLWCSHSSSLLLLYITRSW